MLSLLLACHRPSPLQNPPIAEYPDEPTPPRGAGRIFLAPWPPTGNTLLESATREWVGAPGTEMGDSLQVLRGLYGTGTDGVLVRGPDLARLVDPTSVSGPLEGRLLGGPLQNFVRDAKALDDLDGDGRAELALLMDPEWAVSPPTEKLLLVPGSALVDGTDDLFDLEGAATRVRADEPWYYGNLGAPLVAGERVWIPVGSEHERGEPGDGRFDLVDLSATPVPSVPVRADDRYDGLRQGMPLTSDLLATVDARQRDADDVKVGQVGIFDLSAPSTGARDVDDAPVRILGDEDHELIGPLRRYPDVDGDGIPELLVDCWLGPTLAFASTSFGQGTLTPADASWSAWAVDLAPDTDGDGLPELLYGHSALIGSADVPWDGEDLGDLPTLWEGELGYQGDWGRSNTYQFGFLEVEGAAAVVVGLPAAL